MSQGHWGTYSLKINFLVLTLETAGRLLWGDGDQQEACWGHTATLFSQEKPAYPSLRHQSGLIPPSPMYLPSPGCSLL